ncbi:hypothetical protein [Methyloversatilis universalis]|jgi:hypothetical protein|uniref:hypothetical protein n=1 Tax=Methyloversatilis universalis TaxID=378211 RepID=UPI00031B6ADA|nr:hypothetical protein [Methyloversatilis universalis]
MRYLRLQRSQANRRRAEREAERAGVQSRAQGAPVGSTTREAANSVGEPAEPRRRREN